MGNSDMPFNEELLYVGYYALGEKGSPSVHFCFKHKPFIVRRFFMKLLLGFRWEDNNG